MSKKQEPKTYGEKLSSDLDGWALLALILFVILGLYFLSNCEMW
jgi:hypothetical protein